jgi:hypothetical protein
MEAVHHDGQGEAGLADAAFAVGVAASVGIDLPQACIDGVVANLALLREHAARIDNFVLPGEIGMAE